MLSANYKLSGKGKVHPKTGPERDLGARWGWVVNAMPRERPGTHCVRGWVRPIASLDRCGKYRPHWDSIPGLSSL